MPLSPLAARPRSLLRPACSPKWYTIGQNGDTWATRSNVNKAMDISALYMLFVLLKAARPAGQRASAFVSLLMITSTVAVHEYGHALTMDSMDGHCAETVIYHRIAWGYAGCVKMGAGAAASASAAAAAAAANSAAARLGVTDWVADEHKQWWIAANGTLFALAYLLLFVVALRLLTACTRLDLGEGGIARVYDFGVHWALVWYPVMSVATQWGDFVTIYDAKKHKALVFFFLCVQAAFLAGHSAVRGFVARKLCCCLCGGKKEEKRTPATLTAGANGDVTVHQHGNIQMVM